ncbi:MAG: sugar ABC transporter substrate-binding protein [Oscillospiraceae bacterium]|nr:sugar ABC transporter substrate-binding protein [Oscillospiraceae bacterium]
MKKALALVLTAILVLSVFAGCGSKKTGPVELTLQLWDEAQQPVIQENVDKFNAAHEGEIHVTIEQIPWGTYWTKLDASLETDEAPDVFWMNVYVYKYADAGLLEPLDAYIKKDNFDTGIYAQGRLNAYNLSGVQYALPKGLDTVAVALNTEIFSRYGVDLPKEGWTWDDMRAIATQLKDAIAAAGGSEYPIVMELDGQPSWMNFLYQNGGYFLSDDGKTTGVAEAASKDAVQQVVDLMANGQMAPYSVLSETKGTDLFISGQAGIVFIGSWKSSVLESSTLAENGNIQLIQMPKMAVNNSCNMGGLGYVMSSRCENKDAAWELIKYITGPEAEAYEAEKGIDIPACLSAQSAYVANFKNINAQVFMDASTTGFAYPSNGNFDWTGYVDDAMAEAFSGTKTVSDALDNGAAQAQAVLDELFK